jgi:hypothetical protein
MASKKGQIAGHTLGNLSFGNKLPLPESSAADHVRLFFYIPSAKGDAIWTIFCALTLCAFLAHTADSARGVMPLALMLSAAREAPSVNENWARTFLSLLALGIV